MPSSSPSTLRSACRDLARPRWDAPYLALLLAAEAALTALVVRRVPYTEIDWVAYMQEVTAYERGERDYVNIRGDTGPLVYPAGFLYLYGWFKSWAIGGAGAGGSSRDDDDPRGLDGSASASAIGRMQWLFVALYLINAAAVLSLYQRLLRRARRRLEGAGRSSAAAVWSWRVAMGVTCVSKRVHSIFVLRLFNDAPAMLLLHLSVWLFACRDAWALGCLVFSLAVSVKMNVLLFAPGLLLLLLQRNRCLLGTAVHLAICAAVQVALGWPFLSTYPVSYVKKAFEFDRVFFFEWTVNWKFLPEELFVSKPWALALLACHLGTLGFLAAKWWNASISQRGRTRTREWLRWTKEGGGDNNNLRLSPEYVMYTMFASNYIGIAFARTLHYQFYCWYFHSLPLLHWMATDYASGPARMAAGAAVSTVAIFGVEYAFNVFPATAASSMILQLSHLFLLVKIFAAGVPLITDDVDRKKTK